MRSRPDRAAPNGAALIWVKLDVDNAYSDQRCILRFLLTAILSICELFFAHAAATGVD